MAANDIVGLTDQIVDLAIEVVRPMADFREVEDHILQPINRFPDSAANKHHFVLKSGDPKEMIGFDANRLLGGRRQTETALARYRRRSRSVVFRHLLIEIGPLLLSYAGSYTELLKRRSVSE